MLNSHKEKSCYPLEFWCLDWNKNRDKCYLRLLFIPSVPAFLFSESSETLIWSNTGETERGSKWGEWGRLKTLSHLPKPVDLVQMIASASVYNQKSPKLFTLGVIRILYPVSILTEKEESIPVINQCFFLCNLSFLLFCLSRQQTLWSLLQRSRISRWEREFSLVLLIWNFLTVI